MNHLTEPLSLQGSRSTLVVAPTTILARVSSATDPAMLDTCLVNPTWQSPLDVQSPSPIKLPLDLGLPWVWNSLTDSRGAMICGSLDSKACWLSVHLSDCHLPFLCHSPSVSHFGNNNGGMGIEPSCLHLLGFPSQPSQHCLMPHHPPVTCVVCTHL